MISTAGSDRGKPGAENPIRVLVVDDSAFMQRRLTEILHSTPDLKVIACAANGLDAISLSERLRPDVITMDINMPKMDGLMAIGHLMRVAPRPIVVVSSYTRKCAQAAFQALDLGAIDVVEKASDTGVSLDMERSAAELIRKVRQASRIRVVRSGGMPSALPNKARTSAQAPTPRKDPPANGAASQSAPAVIVIGSSTGGPAALRELFRAIPSADGPPIVVVQHLPANFTAALAEQLADVSCIRVQEAVAGQTLQLGHAYIAPGHSHIEIDAHMRVVLNTDPPVKHCRPSVDVLFASVARQCGATALAIVLTGMGDDGADGSLAMKRAGACIIAQDEETSLVYGMPRAVVAAGAATRVLSLDQIKSVLVDVTLNKSGAAAAISAASTAATIAAPSRVSLS